jgi:Acetyltransferase (GNAT) domain
VPEWYGAGHLIVRMSPIVEAEHIQEKDFPLYEAFATKHGGVFNSPLWRSRVHGDRLRYYGIFTKQGHLCGVFHLYQYTKWGFTFIRNPPFMPHTGLVIDNHAQNDANYLSFNKDALTALTRCLNGLRYSVLSISLPPAVVDTQPFFWSKYKVVPGYTYQHDLTVSDAELMGKFSTNVRNSIKKAMKDGVRAEQCVDYEVVRSLVKSTFSRRQKALNEHTVEAILRGVAAPENSFAFVALWEDRPVATAFCIYDRTTCYYLFGGYDNTAMHRGAGVVCLFSCMRHAQELGLEMFDFEGSMMPEVESYFRSFGPALVPYYTINKARLPFEMALKFIRRERF